MSRLNSSSSEERCDHKNCRNEGQRNCDLCARWLCLLHVKLFVGNPGEPAYYVCQECVDAIKENQAAVSRD